MLAFTLVFSPTIGSLGLSDVKFSYGSFYAEDISLSEQVIFNQEVIGVNIVTSSTPDFEGIVFMLADGTFERIGKGNSYTPNSSHFN